MEQRYHEIPAAETFRGPRGPRGEPFTVDTVGPKAERPLFEAGVWPLSYLADDTGEISVKRATQWGPWIPFRGLDGRSAYEVWLAQPGNEGQTVDQFLAAIRGPDGRSAYQVWMDLGNAGDEAAFFEALRGPEGASSFAVWLSSGNTGDLTDYFADIQGPDGLSAYEVWEAQPENTGRPVTEFLESLGGIPGLSAYDVWLNQGNVGDVDAFLDELTGPPGWSAYEEWIEAGNAGEVSDFFESLRGAPGDEGPKGDSFKPDAGGTIADRTEWDLQGPGFLFHSIDENVPHGLFYYKRSWAAGDWHAGVQPAAGAPGEPGPSAYQTWLDLGNTGDEAAFFAFLRGPRGLVGPGVPIGGAVGQVLSKSAAGDYQTGWTDPASGGTGGASPGDLKFSSRIKAETGWARANAAEVSRVEEATLFEATTILQDGTTASASAVVTGLASTMDVGPGMPVEGPGIGPGVKVLRVDSASQITLTNQAGVGAGTGPVRVLPHGQGNGATLTNPTTFNLIDMRGRSAVGSGYGGDGMTNRKAGEKLGAEKVRLTDAQSGLPLHNHGYRQMDSAQNNNRAQGSYNTPITSSSSTTTSVGGTDAAESHENMQPSTVGSWFVKLS